MQTTIILYIISILSGQLEDKGHFATMDACLARGEEFYQKGFKVMCEQQRVIE